MEPTTHITFSLEKLNSSMYGYDSWKLFWNLIKPKELKECCLLSGDLVCNGKEEYVIAVNAVDENIHMRLAERFVSNPIYKNVAGEKGAFFETTYLQGLNVAGKINPSGKYIDIGNTYAPDALEMFKTPWWKFWS